MVPPTPAPASDKAAKAVTVEKLDGVAEAAHAFQDAAVSQEELERLTVPEGISDAERAQLYMSGGQAVQQAAVIENLPGLLRAAGRGVFATISRSLAEAARQLDGEGQLAAAESFATVARERLLTPSELADAILPLVLAGVGDIAHPVAQSAWLTCLADVAAALDPFTLHSRVLPAAVQRGSGSGRILRERCLCCQLLGVLAPHIDEEDLKRTLLRLAATLCQDTEWQVRHAACQQLPVLAAAAATKLEAAALDGVLEDLFSMLEDEEALVKAAAWRALAAMLDLLPIRLRRTRALPLMLHQCRDPEHHAEVHRSVTAGFGELLVRLVADMEGDADVNSCLGYFRSQAWRHDHATRLNCATAFPAVLRADTARRYSSHLHDTFLRLASDTDAEVRLAAAGALPEVAALLGRERCCQYLRQPVAALLQDEWQEVQVALLVRLPEVLEHFCLGSHVEARSKVLTAFVEPLMRLEAVSGYSWRLQLALLRAIAAFPAFYAPEQLYERFLPLAWKYMTEGAAAVREAAAAAAAAIWRALCKPMHRIGLYGRVVHDFGQSKSFRQLMVFLDFCRHVQRHFSSKFVKYHLLEAALSLAYDPVANVRLHLAAAMPALKNVLTLPDDVHLLERLNSGMSHLITDGDADVRREARKANEEFKRQPVRMSCGPLESSPGEVKEFEAADAARTEAERDFVFDPEQLDKIHADIAAYDEQLRPAHARLLLPIGRADSLRSEVSARGGKLFKQKSVPVAVAGGAALSPHLRSSSDVPETRRDKGLAASLQGSRSASADAAVDGQQHIGAELGGFLGSCSAKGEGERRKDGMGSAGSRIAARMRGSCPGESMQHSGGASTPTLAVLAAKRPGRSASDETAAGGAARGAQQQQRQCGGPSRLSRQSPPAAAGKAQPAGSRLSRPSPFSPAASKRPPPESALLVPVPAAPQPMPQPPVPAAAMAAPVGAIAAAGFAPTAGALNLSISSGSSRKLLRRPSLNGAATRAAVEVQHLALKLRSALLYAEPGSPGAAAPSQQQQAQQANGGARSHVGFGGSSPGKPAGSSSGGSIKGTAEGGGSGGGNPFSVSIRAMHQAAGNNRPSDQHPGR